jgi:hypothetical protein
MDRFFARRLDDGRASYLFRIRPDGRVFFFRGGRWIERRGPYSADAMRLRRTATDYRYRALYAGDIELDELSPDAAGAVMEELAAA